MEISLYGEPQSPLTAFSEAINYADAVVDDPDTYEFGCAIEFLKDGRITKLLARLPDDGTYRVSLWNLTDTMQVTSVEITVDSGQTASRDIDVIQVAQGDKYAITVLSNDFYVWNKGGIPAYPSWAGDVRINGYGYISNPIYQVYPNEFPGFYYAGLADLMFEPLLE